MYQKPREARENDGLATFKNLLPTALYHGTNSHICAEADDKILHCLNFVIGIRYVSLDTRWLNNFECVILTIILKMLDKI